MAKPYTKELLIGKFSEALGIEKARSLVEEVLRQTELEKQTVFYKEEVLRIATALRARGGFIAIIANCLASESFQIGDK